MAWPLFSLHPFFTSLFARPCVAGLWPGPQAPAACSWVRDSRCSAANFAIALTNHVGRALIAHRPWLLRPLHTTRLRRPIQRLCIQSDKRLQDVFGRLGLQR